MSENHHVTDYPAREADREHYINWIQKSERRAVDNPARPDPVYLPTPEKLPKNPLGTIPETRYDG